jgi:hypothetical protein
MNGSKSKEELYEIFKLKRMKEDMDNEEEENEPSNEEILKSMIDNPKAHGLKDDGEEDDDGEVDIS